MKNQQALNTTITNLTLRGSVPLETKLKIATAFTLIDFNGKGFAMTLLLDLGQVCPLLEVFHKMI